VNIPLETARELRVEYTPENADSMDPFAVISIITSTTSSVRLLWISMLSRRNLAEPALPRRAGHHFMMLDNIVFCYLIAVP